MNKKIFIRDYDAKKKKIEIKDFENVMFLTIQILSGDEVLTVRYKDNSMKKFDSSDCRTTTYFDEEYDLPIELVDEFSNFEGSSYDCSSYIEELKKQREEIDKEIERLENQKRFRAKKDEEYYFIDSLGDTEFNCEDNDDIDDFRYLIRNYKQTEEEIETKKRIIETKYKLMDLAERLNNGVKIDWTDNYQKKLYLYFDYFDKKIHRSYENTCKDKNIYCLDENFIDKALEEIGEERLIEYFKDSEV